MRVPACTECKHYFEKEDGVQACKAFPDEIPNNYYFNIPPINIYQSCTNGYSYEHKKVRSEKEAS
jgi:hypothetical protein